MEKRKVTLFDFVPSFGTLSVFGMEKQSDIKGEPGNSFGTLSVFGMEKLVSEV